MTKNDDASQSTMLGKPSLIDLDRIAEDAHGIPEIFWVVLVTILVTFLILFYNLIAFAFKFEGIERIAMPVIEPLAIGEMLFLQLIILKRIARKPKSDLRVLFPPRTVESEIEQIIAQCEEGKVVLIKAICFGTSLFHDILHHALIRRLPLEVVMFNHNATGITGLPPADKERLRENAELLLGACSHDGPRNIVKCTDIMPLMRAIVVYSIDKRAKAMRKPVYCCLQPYKLMLHRDVNKFVGGSGFTPAFIVDDPNSPKMGDFVHHIEEEWQRLARASAEKMPIDQAVTK